MAGRPNYSPELRRKNVRLALVVAAVVIVVAILAVPFWIGLIDLAKTGVITR